MAKAKSSSRHDPVPPLEWAAAAVGLLLALLLVGTLAVHALDSADAPPPLLSVEAGRLANGAGGYVVEFELANASARTAAAVQVEGVLKLGGAEVEKSSASVDYVAGHSRADGGLVFSRDPRSHALELRVTGYEIP